MPSFQAKLSHATASTIETPPIGCTYTAYATKPAGVLVDNPLGQPYPYIFEKCGSNRVWKWSGSAWVLKAYTHQFVYSSPSEWAVIACAPLGVFWCIPGGTNYAQPTKVWRPND